jgi:transcriptional regulator with PAS, ATPase and Fis domain
VTLTLLPPDPEDKTMSADGFWLEEFPVAVTVTDAQGTILTMNAHSRKSFEADGGAALIGTSVFDCHPEPARTKTLELFEQRRPSHYTIRKNGQKKIIHQIPWYRDGAFAGFVEISIPIPDSLPHFDRD